MSFNGSEGEIISLETGAVMTASFRNTITPGDIIGQYIGADIINRILAQKDCVGIRFYYAMDDNNSKNLVCVGVDENENDLCSGLIANHFISCPPHCSNSNSLNS
ncbi:MAG: hypothetical protein RIQ59_1449 [Bacteroidota bacterium]|jgi:hypothetical protein